MIKLWIDEGHAFDMLSVLQIKKSLNADYIHIETYNILARELDAQLGSELYFSIIGSEEYKTLLEINRKIFDLLDNIDENMSALVVHNANMERFKAKAALQTKFFSMGLTEQKI